MFSKNKIIVVLIFELINCFPVLAQDTIQDTKTVFHDNISKNVGYKNNRLNYRNLIAPAVLIGFGIISLENDGLKQLNFSTRDEINEHRLNHTPLDNYSQYMPAAMVYGLNAAGIKGRHNFKERTIIYATSQLISAAFVLPLKHITKEERPDGSNNLSFPSGHTATAFSSAQFMFREYRDTNFLLAISGYSFAVFTGVYRTINDKHWVDDVVAGAGFGILSTELAYWLFPKINGLLTGAAKENKSVTAVAPFFQSNSFGLGLIYKF